MTAVEWSKSERNLLMVLSTRCHFCSESMPFYQRLTEKASHDTRLRLIAALPQEIDESKKYLGDHNVVVDEVISASPDDAMVRGTPTLLLLDKNGVVLQIWIGKLSPEKENEVLTRVLPDLAQL